MGTVYSARKKNGKRNPVKKKARKKTFTLLMAVLGNLFNPTSKKTYKKFFPAQVK